MDREILESLAICAIEVAFKVESAGRNARAGSKGW
jgi:hypothetical protein